MATSLRKEREVRERELRLMDVARRMLIAQGYAGLSMDRLAEATEYSKGTVYQHFSTKEDLVMALAAQTMAQRVSLFERVARFRGRSRERMIGLGIADEIYAKQYPHSFRSELIIKMADLEDRASSARKEALRVEESRCTELCRSFIEQGVADGDLPANASVATIMFASITMVIGTHTLVASFPALVEQVGIADPHAAARHSIHMLFDGFGWKPLLNRWDYAKTERRFAREIFADVIDPTHARPA